MNLIYDLRRVACCPSHSKDFLNFITPPRNRTSPNCFEGSHASSTLAGHFIKEPTTGFAPASTCLQDGRLSQSSHVGSSQPSLQQARGFEPHMSVLEADCSPRSTLADLIEGDRAESNRCQTDSQSVSGNQHRTRPQRTERELNPQGTNHARPASNRFPSPIGWPFQFGFCRRLLFFIASTRTRTRNSSLEARNDFRFTIEA